jgi:hypothetical protein
MAFKVFHSVLPFTVFGLVQILHNLSPSRLRSFKVRINIIDEYREALSLMPDLRGAGAPWPRAIEHYPGIAEMHLRAVDSPASFAITVVLGETECVRQPNDRSGNILISDVWQYDIRWHRAVFQHQCIIPITGYLPWPGVSAAVHGNY